MFLELVRRHLLLAIRTQDHVLSACCSCCSPRHIVLLNLHWRGNSFGFCLGLLGTLSGLGPFTDTLLFFVFLIGIPHACILVLRLVLWLWSRNWRRCHLLWLLGV